MRLLLILIGCLILVTESRDKFWAIAHMANNENVLGWSLAAGANALEIDVEFSQGGYPVDAYHGSPCDCTCLITVGVCQFPISQVCTGRRPIAAVLGYFMSHQQRDQVAMIYLDSKSVPAGQEVQAGKAMITLIQSVLFNRGYQGKVIIGGEKVNYLTSVAEAAKISQFHQQIFVTYDMYTTYDESLEYIASLDYTRKVVSPGITACVQPFSNFAHEVVLGRINKAKGVASEVILWTLDNERDFDKYYDLGARGIISNNVAGLVLWAKKRGYDLYRMEDVVGATTADTASLQLNRGSCSCQVDGAGCRIDTPAPRHSACQCSYNGLTCAGSVVGCRDLTDPACSSPDTSLSACLLGSGNCGGYEGYPSCECGGSDTEGCRVTVAPSGGRACRCSLEKVDEDEVPVCRGEVVECREPGSPYCTASTSLQSCLQGGGNCLGYPAGEQCSCSWESSGCRITSPAAPDTACKCHVYGRQCTASSEICYDPTSSSCTSPDTSFSACLQGSGNCEGYGGTCDCSYRGKGCAVTRPAPPGSACNCYNKFWWTCYGDVVRCGNPQAEECISPDASMGSCHQGGGNCAGY